MVKSLKRETHSQSKVKNTPQVCMSLRNMQHTLDMEKSEELSPFSFYQNVKPLISTNERALKENKVNPKTNLT